MTKATPSGRAEAAQGQRRPPKDDGEVGVEGGAEREPLTAPARTAARVRDRLLELREELVALREALREAAD
jgi:hypothetical protein